VYHAENQRDEEDCGDYDDGSEDSTEDEEDEEGFTVAVDRSADRSVVIVRPSRKQYRAQSVQTGSARSSIELRKVDGDNSFEAVLPGTASSKASSSTVDSSSEALKSLQLICEDMKNELHQLKESQLHQQQNQQQPLPSPSPNRSASRRAPQLQNASNRPDIVADAARSSFDSLPEHENVSISGAHQGSNSFSQRPRVTALVTPDTAAAAAAAAPATFSPEDDDRIRLNESFEAEPGQDIHREVGRGL
jgi:hypothetical protein